MSNRLPAQLDNAFPSEKPPTTSPPLIPPPPAEALLGDDNNEADPITLIRRIRPSLSPANKTRPPLDSFLEATRQKLRQSLPATIQTLEDTPETQHNRRILYTQIFYKLEEILIPIRLAGFNTSEILPEIIKRQKPLFYQYLRRLSVPLYENFIGPSCLEALRNLLLLDWEDPHAQSKIDIVIFDIFIAFKIPPAIQTDCL